MEVMRMRYALNLLDKMSFKSVKENFKEALEIKAVSFGMKVGNHLPSYFFLWDKEGDPADGASGFVL